jgi:hypothetical protein
MKLPELNVDYGNLYTMFFSPIRLKLLLTGIELKIFNHLTNPTSAEDVAQKINTHPNNTKILLNGLAAIDLVNKKNNLYQNTPVAQTFLVEDNQTYLGQLLVFMATSEPELENLTKLVKEGPPKKLKQPPFSEDLLTKTAEMMANIEVAGDAQQLLQIVSELPEYNKFKKMLDLGGGPGLIGLTIVNSHPTLKGVIFDLPPVVRVAKTYIKKYRMEKRMTTLGGDFNHDLIGEGYDLIITSNCLQFSQELDPVIKKIYNALNLGGVFISMSGFGKTNEGTKPENLVLGLVPRALLGQETKINHGDIANSMLHNGFKSVHSRTINSSWGPMELDIARK